MDNNLIEKNIDRFLEFIEFEVEDLISKRPVITRIPDTHYRLLYHLSSVEKTSMKELGDLMSVSKTYITKIVDTLTVEGLVERIPDTDDRRVINIMLTKAGEQRFYESHLRMREEVIKRLNKMPLDDLEILGHSMELFMDIWKKNR